MGNNPLIIPAGCHATTSRHASALKSASTPDIQEILDTLVTLGLAHQSGEIYSH